MSPFESHLIATERMRQFALEAAAHRAAASAAPPRRDLTSAARHRAAVALAAVAARLEPHGATASMGDTACAPAGPRT
jgi:hypothetical protein